MHRRPCPAKAAKPNINSHSILGPTLGKEKPMGTGEFELKPWRRDLCRLQEYKGKIQDARDQSTIIDRINSTGAPGVGVKVPDLDNSIIHWLSMDLCITPV